MKTVVIYKSKTGFAKRYAKWISDELDADLYEASAFDPACFGVYDAVVFGGGLYVGGINGIKLITRNLDLLKNKKVVVFASGATPNREATTQEIFDLNFTQEQKLIIKFFYLRGGFDFSKLGIIDKLLMTLLKLKLKMRPAAKRSPDEAGMLAAYTAPCDFSKKRYITDLVNYINTR